MTSGVFGWSRNPIFVGMKITLLGLFLIIPNALILLAFVLGVVLIQIQVRLEEDFLVKIMASNMSSTAGRSADGSRSSLNSI